MPLAAIDWTTVLVALIAAVPASIAAFASLSNRRALKTPSGTRIGKQVEDVNHTARSNWHTLDAVRRDVGITQSPKAAQEMQAVDGLEPDGDE